jgi:carboxypeptidase Taq
MSESMEKLKARMSDIGHLHRAMAVLEWDMQTYMPPGGAVARADQIALLSRLAHEQLTDPETGRLLAMAEAEVSGMDPGSEDACLVRNVRRDYEHAVKIPTELAEELSRHTALSQDIWAKARAESNFAAFAPALEHMFDLLRQVAECLGYEEEPYDALLDQYEPGAKTRQIAAHFHTLQPVLRTLTQAITASPECQKVPELTGFFPIEAQQKFVQQVIRELGYDFERGRQDQSPHPFCTTFSRDDVRITTRYHAERPEVALYAALHEAGHALYEQGIPAEYDNTPLGGGASSGVHESQSRLWENLVGRSHSYCTYIFPKLRQVFPEPLAGWDAERFYRAVNRVAPSFIRVEADEVTYNLHVLMRFELERDLLMQRLTVNDLPEAWNAKMQEYLGITPPDNAQGVLQDIHWSAGLVGYFPTYTLGNLLSTQLWHALQQAIPGLDSQIEQGDFAPLLQWLREHVHCYGRKYLPDELIRRVTGEPLTAQYYVEYLRGKFAAIYGL